MTGPTREAVELEAAVTAAWQKMRGDIDDLHACEAAIRAHERSLSAPVAPNDAEFQRGYDGAAECKALVDARIALGEAFEAHAIAATRQLQRTCDFQSAEYLRVHGGSWGVCKWQAENGALREALETFCDLAKYVEDSGPVEDAVIHARHLLAQGAT